MLLANPDIENGSQENGPGIKTKGPQIIEIHMDIRMPIFKRSRLNVQGGVDQLVRKGKVRHRIPTRSWVRTLGKSSPPKWEIPAATSD